MDWFLWVYRHAYWCCRRFCPRETSPKDIFVSPATVPWLWVGMRYSDEESITVTNIIAHQIYPGMRVTPDALTTITGFKDGVWRYIDSETLEERDFPSEGFIIEDVLDKPLSDSE
jgi:hypothetical protein